MRTVASAAVVVVAGFAAGCGVIEIRQFSSPEEGPRLTVSRYDHPEVGVFAADPNRAHVLLEPNAGAVTATHRASSSDWLCCGPYFFNFVPLPGILEALLPRGCAPAHGIALSFDAERLLSFDPWACRLRAGGEVVAPAEVTYFTPELDELDTKTLPPGRLLLIDPEDGPPPGPGWPPRAYVVFLRFPAPWRANASFSLELGGLRHDGGALPPRTIRYRPGAAWRFLFFP